MSYYPSNEGPRARFWVDPHSAGKTSYATSASAYGSKISSNPYQYSSYKPTSSYVSPYSQNKPTTSSNSKPTSQYSTSQPGNSYVSPYSQAKPTQSYAKPTSQSYAAQPAYSTSQPYSSAQGYSNSSSQGYSQANSYAAPASNSYAPAPAPAPAPALESKAAANVMLAGVVPHDMESEPVQAQVINRGVTKAVFIGINYVGQQGELRGCINDVKNGISTLQKMGFVPKTDQNIKVLTDTEKTKPTRANIIASMQWLLTGAKAGDVLWFHYSGHGGQIPGSESDGYTECIFPVDYNRAGTIIDDVLHENLAKALPAGATLYSIMDCCHSGSIMDLRWIYDEFKHTLLPDADGYETNGKVFMISGCQKTQTSADMPLADKQISVGALSNALYPMIPQGLSWNQLIGKVRQAMKSGRLTQIPQFEVSLRHDVDEVAFLSAMPPQQASRAVPPPVPLVDCDKSHRPDRLNCVKDAIKQHRLHKHHEMCCQGLVPPLEILAEQQRSMGMGGMGGMFRQQQQQPQRGYAPPPQQQRGYAPPPQQQYYSNPSNQRVPMYQQPSNPTVYYQNSNQQRGGFNDAFSPSGGPQSLRGLPRYQQPQAVAVPRYGTVGRALY